MRFTRFASGQQKFRGFNFHKWLLTREKRENKSLAKITNHTVYYSDVLLYFLSMIIASIGNVKSYVFL